jgi:hypothetical protein
LKPKNSRVPLRSVDDRMLLKGFFVRVRLFIKKVDIAKESFRKVTFFFVNMGAQMHCYTVYKLVVQGKIGGRGAECCVWLNFESYVGAIKKNP